MVCGPLRGAWGGKPGQKTIEEAQANLKEAVELYIESFGADEVPSSNSGVMFYPLEIAVNV